MLSDEQRWRFDAVLDGVVEGLPEHLRGVLEEVPLIVDDEPARELCGGLGLDGDEDQEPGGGRGELCGLHWGVPLTLRSVEMGARMPDRMMLFRGPILRTAAAGSGRGPRPGKITPEDLHEQVRITLLHEIGHHFGLDEQDLSELGYG